MQAIKEVLHDPGSASFEHSDKADLSIRANRAVVIRSLRGTNGFGAVRKTEYICFLEKRQGAMYSVLVAEKGTKESQVGALMKRWKMP